MFHPVRIRGNAIYNPSAVLLLNAAKLDSSYRDG